MFKHDRDPKMKEELDSVLKQESTPRTLPFIVAARFHDPQFGNAERVEFFDQRLSVNGLEMNREDIHAVVVELAQLFTERRRCEVP